MIHTFTYFLWENTSKCIPRSLKGVAVNTLTNPKHLLLVGSLGLASLSPIPTICGNWYIPVAFQSATLLAALAHPDHLQLVGSWSLAYLPPSSNLKSFGYRIYTLSILLLVLAFTLEHGTTLTTSVSLTWRALARSLVM
ncbi:MAG: hypothetical protein QS721_10005 [Candidatus Endonucleobacter sp. (ex Gigantidas childressi)]|nr:hypothetical protein [Candidatus Endonucleobacter sp. (ex Gigantidas childressi)]